jgi:hypothetical protein
VPGQGDDHSSRAVRSFTSGASAPTVAVAAWPLAGVIPSHPVLSALPHWDSGLSLPQSTAAAQGERLAGIASIGGLFLLAGLALINSSPDPRSAIFITFAFMSTVAPLLAAFLIYMAERLGFPGPKPLGYCLSAVKTVLLSLPSRFLAAPCSRLARGYGFPLQF